MRFDFGVPLIMFIQQFMHFLTHVIRLNLNYRQFASHQHTHETPSTCYASPSHHNQYASITSPFPQFVHPASSSTPPGVRGAPGAPPTLRHPTLAPRSAAATQATTGLLQGYIQGYPHSLTYIK